VAHLTQAGYSPKSIDHIHDALSAILRTAMKWGQSPLLFEGIEPQAAALDPLFAAADVWNELNFGGGYRSPNDGLFLRPTSRGEVCRITPEVGRRRPEGHCGLPACVRRCHCARRQRQLCHRSNGTQMAVALHPLSAKTVPDRGVLTRTAYVRAERSEARSSGSARAQGS